MRSINKSFSFLLLFTVTLSLAFSSCKGEEELDECMDIMKLDEEVTFNSKTYQLSDPNYNDVLINNYQFSFDAVNEDCTEIVDILLNYNKFVGFPDNTLNGTFDLTFVNNTLELEEFEASASYRNGNISRSIRSGTSSILENADGTVTLTLNGTDEDEEAVNFSVTYAFF